MQIRKGGWGGGGAISRKGGGGGKKWNVTQENRTRGGNLAGGEVLCIRMLLQITTVYIFNTRQDWVCLCVYKLHSNYCKSEISNLLA